MPLLWVMKGSYFGFGIPNNRLTWMQGQKTLSLSYYMHLFCLPYLLNDSFFGPLLCVTLICGDWSQFHFISPDKAAFVMWAKNSKMNLHLHSDQQVGGQYANVSCWSQHERAWDSFNKRLVTMIQSRLFLLRDNNFIHFALSDLKLWMCSFTYSCVKHCMKCNFQKSIMGPFNVSENLLHSALYEISGISGVWECDAARTI